MLGPALKGRPLPRPSLLQRILSSRAFAVIAYGVVMGGLIWAAYSGAAQMGYNWQWYRVPQYLYTLTEDGFQAGEILQGLGQTIILSTIAFLLSCVIGLVLALLRLSDLIVGRALAVGLIEFIRNVPLLVLLYMVYYILGPVFGIDRFWASILTLAVFHSVLIAEILRAGVEAIPKGQWEGARSIGMSEAQTYRYIVLPQSVPFVLPPLFGEVVHLIKSSAIVSVIAVAELTTTGRNIISETYMSFEIWFTVAAVYLVLTLILSFGVSRVERRYAFQK